MKYESQICAVKHKNQTLGVDNKFYAPSAEDIENDISYPWEIHGKYSKVILTLIETGTKKYTSFNLNAHDIPKLFEDSKFYNYMHLQKQMNKTMLSAVNKDEKLSIAYTTVISLGNFKGKTPAQILIDNPNDKDNLLKTKDFLSKNADKYPANKKQMDAIDDAINLLSNNELQKNKTEAQTEVIPTKIVFYDKIKCNPIKEKQGLMDVKKITISYNPEMKSPINVTILNCVAPSSNNGLISVDMSKCSDKKEISMFMGMDEWFETISRINTVKNLWEMQHIPGDKTQILEKKLEDILTYLINN